MKRVAEHIGRSRLSLRIGITKRAGGKELRLLRLALTMVIVCATPARAGVNLWTNRGPQGQSVTALSIDPSNPATLYAGTGNGVFKSWNGGESWFSVGPSSLVSAPTQSRQRVLALGIAPSAPTTIFAGLSQGSRSVSNNAGVFTSANGGADWSAGLQTLQVNSVAFDPAAPSTVYAGTSTRDAGIQKSTDGGKSWKAMTSLNGPILALLIDSKNSSTLYASVETDFDYPNVGEVMKSTDGGGTWKQVLDGYDYFRSLVIDPSDSSTLYAGEFGIFKSTDGGSTWNALPAEILSTSINAVVIDPVRPKTLYAGTSDRGVLRSADGGATWARFGVGLSDLDVVALAIDKTGTSLLAGTPSGAFDMDIGSGPLDVSVAPDGSTRFFSFDAPGGSVTLGAFDPAGGISTGPPLGPFDGWTPRASAVGEDGLTRVLWTHQDGYYALWLAEPQGVRTAFRLAFVSGLIAVDVAARSETHLLLADTNGRAALQTIGLSGTVTNSLSLGPFAGWRASAISDGPDGLTRILWNHLDGRAGISAVSSAGIVNTVRYGPITGWRAVDVAVGGDGLTRILWASDDNRVSLGILNVSGELLKYGQINSAPAGAKPARLDSGADGSSRVLFNQDDGGAIVWVMSAGGDYLRSFTFEPSSSSEPPSLPDGTSVWDVVLQVTSVSGPDFCIHTPAAGDRFRTTYQLVRSGNTVSFLHPQDSIDWDTYETTLFGADFAATPPPFSPGPDLCTSYIEADKFSGTFAADGRRFAATEVQSFTFDAGSIKTITFSWSGTRE